MQRADLISDPTAKRSVTYSETPTTQCHKQLELDINARLEEQTLERENGINIAERQLSCSEGDIRMLHFGAGKTIAAKVPNGSKKRPIRLNDSHPSE